VRFAKAIEGLRGVTGAVEIAFFMPDRSDENPDAKK
jgi:hypothetical protein